MKYVAREIITEIDNALHDMAIEYHAAGHPEYYAVCEMVYHKVIAPIKKKYESECDGNCQECEFAVWQAENLGESKIVSCKRGKML